MAGLLLTVSTSATGPDPGCTDPSIGWALREMPVKDSPAGLSEHLLLPHLMMIDLIRAREAHIQRAKAKREETRDLTFQTEVTDSCDLGPPPVSIQEFWGGTWELHFSVISGPVGAACGGTRA